MKAFVVAAVMMLPTSATADSYIYQGRDGINYYSNVPVPADPEPRVIGPARHYALPIPPIPPNAALPAVVPPERACATATSRAWCVNAERAVLPWLAQNWNATPLNTRELCVDMLHNAGSNSTLMLAVCLAQLEMNVGNDRLCRSLSNVIPTDDGKVGMSPCTN